MNTRPAIGWIEVHSENYFAEGGAALAGLRNLRNDYAVSLHGVGMGLGSVAPLQEAHLDRLLRLVNDIQPAAVSEHICWGATATRHLNDLLPLPYTDETLTHLCQRVDAVQTRLKRRILVENVSRYLRFCNESMSEWDFVAALTTRTGCGLLLDVNNIYVNAINHDFNPYTYIAAIPIDAVEEIHLAGFSEAQGCLIDTHGTPVTGAVWALYKAALARFGRRPTLIEWDTDIPPLATLLAERHHAQTILDSVVHTEDSHAVA